MRRLLSAATIALCGLASTATAQDLLGSYVAFLSWDDHYNSNGVQLTAPWQVIRQDRANFHRYGRADPGDEWDSFFSSVENREAAERMLAAGTIPPHAARAIMNGETYVLVEIWGSGNRGNYVVVDLLR